MKPADVFTRIRREIDAIEKAAPQALDAIEDLFIKVDLVPQREQTHLLISYEQIELLIRLEIKPKIVRQDAAAQGAFVFYIRDMGSADETDAPVKRVGEVPFDRKSKCEGANEVFDQVIKLLMNATVIPDNPRFPTAAVLLPALEIRRR